MSVRATVLEGAVDGLERGLLGAFGTDRARSARRRSQKSQIVCDQRERTNLCHGCRYRQAVAQRAPVCVNGGYLWVQKGASLFGNTYFININLLYANDVSDNVHLAELPNASPASGVINRRQDEGAQKAR